MAESNELVDLLASLGRALDAAFVQVQLPSGPPEPALGWFASDALTDDERTELVRSCQEWWAARSTGETSDPVSTLTRGSSTIAVAGLYGTAIEDSVLIVVRQNGRPFGGGELETILAFARLTPIAMEQADVGSALDDLVTHLATELMSTNVATVQDALTQVVRTLAEFFNVSTAFLRRNDHEHGLSLLVAEWPPRQDVPDPDPLAVVPFEGPDTDPVFAATRELREPLVIRPDQEDKYQERINQASGRPPVALATVPILRDGVTSGVLGFVNFGDRAWSKAELNALRAIASLLSQLEGRVEAEQLLQRGAYVDELTGLPNRRALREALGERLEMPSTDPVAVVFADLDRLKALNDNLGHTAGDALLRAVADRLARFVNPDDMVARLGGDEFVIVFGSRPDPLAATRELVERIAVEPVRVDNGAIGLTMCAGVAEGVPGTMSPDELLHRADVALIEAKSQGANQVLAFDDQMLAASEMRAEVNRHLHRAVSDGALEVYYLPEVDLRSGELVAMEALVRWHHPSLGLVLPGSFIDQAEKSPSIICEIGEWVLREACRQLESWRGQWPRTHFSLRVNVSAVQLLTGDLAAITEAALGEHHLSGSDLCLEITERAVLSEMESALVVLGKIRERGVAVALDDFGTGYSTLTQLRWLPVDTLKIDRQFVSELGTNAGDAAIVQSTILLAQSFGLEVVAEGVATASAARELLRMGCYRAEGYLIHPPGPAMSLVPLIARGGVDPADLGLPNG